jgi:hypothetical protein
MQFRSRFGLIVLIAALLLIPLAMRFATTELDLSGSALNQSLLTDSGDNSGNEPSVQEADLASEAENEESDSSDNQPVVDESVEDESTDDESAPENDSSEAETTTAAESVEDEVTTVEDESTPEEDTTENESNGDDQSEVTVEANDGSASGDESDDDSAEVTEEADDESTPEPGNESPEATDEPVNNQPEATEEPGHNQPEATEETTPVETPAPEVTEEPAIETTVEVTAEATIEVTAEVQLPAPGITSVACMSGTGVVFAITNSGGDMTEDREYAIDGEAAGSFRLNASESIEIQAGYGDPVLSSDDLEARLGSDCPAPGRIAGYVWENLNGDSTRDEVEPGIAGVVITLTTTGVEAAEPITALTLEDGGYSFELLLAGTYTVTVDTDTLPERLLPSYDLDGETDSQTNIIVEAGQATLADFGYTLELPGAISGMVWADLNGDGARDENEPGLGAAIISLGDRAIGVTTAEDGAYQLAELKAGDYTVSVDVSALLDGYLAPENPAVTITVVAGEITADVNFGILPRPVSVISGVTFTDLNGNGLVDADEPGLPGMNVSLSSGAGELLSTTTTDQTGAYTFSDLSAGLYLVAASIAGEPLPGISAEVNVEAGLDYTANFGFVPSLTGTVSGGVWADADGDGSRSAEESGLGGMNVILLNADGELIAEAVTADDGTYSLADVALGDYIVKLNDVPGGLAATFDPDGELDNQTAVTVTEAGAQADFGYQVMSSSVISGLVWLETGNFGTRDSGETGLARATVRLSDSDGNEIGAVTLQADGRFSFGELEPGLYTLQVDVTALPAQLFATVDPDGELDFSTTIVLRPGDELRDVEFGVVGTF